ncbi:hypothetical protein EJ08DRAFT_207920 [Tothia fuscella]|uniref:Uncharacterized protein n=1 Tax=Tothia fuscella TaxID=1048955 RepID=A0A9P4TY36_9PEZI|nr:hypothetical protein EJ08DRAFT_207920 [Tothia fuscella]
MGSKDPNRISLGQVESFSSYPWEILYGSLSPENRITATESRAESAMDRASLWNLCGTIFQSDRQVANLGEPIYPHHRNENGLKAAEVAGCYICMLISQELSERTKNPKGMDALDNSGEHISENKLYYKLETQDYGEPYLSIDYHEYDIRRETRAWEEVLQLLLLQPWWY